MKQEMMGFRGGSGISWTINYAKKICTSLKTDNDTSASSLNFYSPDAFPDSKPTVSKF